MDDLEFGLDVSSLSVLLNFLAVLYEERFLDFPLRDVFEFDCWLSAIPVPVDGMNRTLSLQNVMASIAGFKLSASCFECADASFDAISEEFLSVNQAIGDFLSPLSRQDSLMHTQIDRWVVDAPKKCRHHPKYDPTYTTESAADFLDLSQSDVEQEKVGTLYVVVVFLLVGLFVFGVSFHFTVKYMVARRHRVWLQSLEPARVATICAQQEQEKKEGSMVESMAGAMFRGAAVPLLVRRLVPLLLLVSTALFVAGFFGSTIGIAVFLKLAGEDLFVVGFNSALTDFLRDMWNGDAGFLAVRYSCVRAGSVLLFRVLFANTFLLSSRQAMGFIGGLFLPLVKNICSLVLWCLPTSVVSTSKRLSFVCILNEMGKFDIMSKFTASHTQSIVLLHYILCVSTALTNTYLAR